MAKRRSAARRLFFTPFFRQPVWQFLGSMRFAVALLCVLAVAAVVGSLVPQNADPSVYVAQFGGFWYAVLRFWGATDVYGTRWFAAILLFLALSLAVCLCRRTPQIWRALAAQPQPDSAAPHRFACRRDLTEAQALADLRQRGFRVFRQPERADIVLAARRGGIGRIGYVLTHAAVLLICVGALADSGIDWRWRVWAGQLRAEPDAEQAQAFPPHSRLPSGSRAFRGTVPLHTGQASGGVFVRLGNGWLWQPLPFQMTLQQLAASHYGDGTPQQFTAAVRIRHDNGAVQQGVLTPNRPLRVADIRLYLMDFGDGGSALRVAQWALQSARPQPVWHNARSLNTETVMQNGQPYALHWGELLPHGRAQTDDGQGWRQMRDTVRDLGARINYRQSDAAGQMWLVTTWQQPMLRDGAWYYAGAVRAGETAAWRWWFLPADRSRSLATFMQWRHVLRDARLRRRAAQIAASSLPAPQGRAALQAAVDTVLARFAQNGRAALPALAARLPESQKSRMQQQFAVLLEAGAQAALDAAADELHQPRWPNGAAKQRFARDALRADDDLQHYPLPAWQQLAAYRAEYAAVLQAARTPGQAWVYAGAWCLLAGLLLMLYVCEECVWLYRAPGGGFQAAVSAPAFRLPERLRQWQNLWAARE